MPTKWARGGISASKSVLLRMRVVRQQAPGSIGHLPQGDADLRKARSTYPDSLREPERTDVLEIVESEHLLARRVASGRGRPACLLPRPYADHLADCRFAEEERVAALRLPGQPPLEGVLAGGARGFEARDKSELLARPDLLSLSCVGEIGSPGLVTIRVLGIQDGLRIGFAGVGDAGPRCPAGILHGDLAHEDLVGEDLLGHFHGDALGVPLGHCRSRRSLGRKSAARQDQDCRGDRCCRERLFTQGKDGSVEASHKRSANFLGVLASAAPSGTPWRQAGDCDRKRRKGDMHQI